MDEAKPISKEKAKFLKRMAKQADRSKTQTARTQNRKAAEKAQREQIAKRHAEIDKVGPSPILGEIRSRMLAPPALDLNQQVALMAGTLAAQREANEAKEHVHGPDCNHKPMLEAVDAESTVIDTAPSTLTPEIVAEAMEKL